MAEKKNKNIEASMKRLDDIAEKMGKEDITLEESFKLFNEGITLVKECREALTGVEKQIRILEEQDKDTNE